MSKVNEAVVARIARLGRIAISETEVKSMTSDVARILEFVDQLQSVDTKNITPTSQVTGLQDVLRADKVVPSEIDAQTLLKLAPKNENGYIVVKRVLE